MIKFQFYIIFIIKNTIMESDTVKKIDYYTDLLP
jgi:hypothetical protein